MTTRRSRVRVPSMGEVPIETLRVAIRSLHGVEATWLESVPVHETFQSETVWQGEVQVFELHKHPSARLCFAWSHEVEGSDGRRFVAVLAQGPIDSPEAAVRAAILQEARERGGLTCPVCGYPKLREPPYTAESGGSFEICPSCGIQFGYMDARDDLREEVYRRWREAWEAGERKPLGMEEAKRVMRTVVTSQGPPDSN